MSVLVICLCAVFAFFNLRFWPINDAALLMKESISSQQAARLIGTTVSVLLRLAAFFAFYVLTSFAFHHRTSK